MKMSATPTSSAANRLSCFKYADRPTSSISRETILRCSELRSSYLTNSSVGLKVENVAPAILVRHPDNCPYDDRPGMSDAHAVVEAIRRSRDPRVKYIISNGRIANSYANGSSPPSAWRTYSGSNKHTKHAHLSVVATKSDCDSTSPWVIE